MQKKKKHPTFPIQIAVYFPSKSKNRVQLHSIFRIFFGDRAKHNKDRDDCFNCVYLLNTVYELNSLMMYSPTILLHITLKNLLFCNKCYILSVRPIQVCIVILYLYLSIKREDFSLFCPPQSYPQSRRYLFRFVACLPGQQQVSP
jgi:hypothetical protein